MKIHIIKTFIPDLIIIETDYFSDDRGFFIEPWHKADFAKAGLNLEFVQEGHSQSKQHVLRGMHYQDSTAPMGKLLRCTHGQIFDVALDIRASSPTLGKWFGVKLSATNKKQIFIPAGFAHGFYTISKIAEVQYKQTGFYTPKAEGTIRWDDPTIKIDWPSQKPILSDRDKSGISFNEYLKHPAFG